ncbi:hypothetical protein [Falsiroseomonas oryzae]|uniref:hypothetical protein n=1 Tax=Falsiroseomonas oryzae TaxID=2766473 RepID=UPI0022EAB2B8|nr:hypothetical protein [Roseomonas sp. MO-31]
MLGFVILVLAGGAWAAALGGVIRAAAPRFILRAAALDLTRGEAGVRRTGFQCAVTCTAAVLVLSIAVVWLRG